MQGKGKNPRTVTLKPECVIPLKLDPGVLRTFVLVSPR